MLDRAGHITQPVRRSPLGHREPIATADGHTHLAEKPFTGKLILRGDHAEISPLLESAPGIALPAEPCGSARSGDVAALWLGPSEWILLTPENDERALAAEIETSLRPVHHQTVEVSDYYTIISIGGEHSRNMLAKLTTLDLHPRAFAAGAVKGSIFARVPAILHGSTDGTADAPGFELIIRWSHADYLWCLLALAGREFGLPEQRPEGRVTLAPPR
jgi:heterotetrameric sarcosine oxidase gamma subunit